MSDEPKQEVYLTPQGGLPSGNWPRSELVRYVPAACIAALEAERDALALQVQRAREEDENMREWADVGINAFGELVMVAADNLQIAEGGKDQVMENYRTALKSALQRARDDALEEAARVATSYHNPLHSNQAVSINTASSIAAAIRALRCATEGAGG